MNIKLALGLMGVAAISVEVCNAYDVRQGQFSCYMATCSGPADCAAARNAVHACDEQMAAKLKAEREAKQREWEQKHQAEIEAQRKIEEANQKMRDVGTNPR